MNPNTLLTDQSVDPMVVLLMACDLTVDDLLSLRRGHVYSGAVVVLDRPPFKRRSLLVPMEARWALRPRGHLGFDPDTHLFADQHGALPTRAQVLEVVGQHLDLLHQRRQTQPVQRAIRRLARAYRQALAAA